MFLLKDSGRAPILYAIPRELWLLVDHLYRHGLRQQNLFEGSAASSEIVQVRDWLDCGAADPPRILFSARIKKKNYNI